MNPDSESNSSLEQDNPQPGLAPTSQRSPTAFWMLFAAGLFMVTGICVLLFIGREKARIIGQEITELDIQPLHNTDKPLTTEDMRGKVVVIHFWGFWCTYCHEGFPDFVKVEEKYKEDKDVVFASISCSDKKNDTKDALIFYTKKYLGANGGEDFPVYYDPVEYSRTQISKLLTSGGFSYPTTLVIDRQGRVVDVWRSVVKEKTLVSSIEKAKQKVIH